MPPEAREPAIADVRRFVELIERRFGYDFQGYALGSLARRLAWLKDRTGLTGPGDLERRLDQDPHFVDQVIDALTVDVSAMFRDPEFFLTFRRKVVPFLRTYPRLRLWVAGCGRGEEVYSLAIILREEGLEERSLIYATDLNPAALTRAREGIYPADSLRSYAESFLRAGGRSSFAGYFTVAHGYAAIDPTLRRRLCFAQHNLVADRVFGQMQVVCCRNVLIYFAPPLQESAVGLLDASLEPGGFLGLGSHESVTVFGVARRYQELVPGSRVYRKRPSE